MKLHNSGLCDYCGETKTVVHFLINCTENGMELIEIQKMPAKIATLINKLINVSHKLKIFTMDETIHQTTE